MTRIPKLVFKADGQVVYQASYPYRSEDVPRNGDAVRIGGKTRVVGKVTYVYGKRGLLRIEILLAGRRKK